MQLDFAKLDGLLPAIVQDAKTKDVLMLGFMNETAYEHTMRTGKVTFWSRTRQKLWTKGETSGNFLFVRRVLADCDVDTLLIEADPVGPVCHTGAANCFFNEIPVNGIPVNEIPANGIPVSEAAERGPAC